MVYLFFIFLFYSFLWFFLFCFSFSLFSLGRGREGRGREGCTAETIKKDIVTVKAGGGLRENGYHEKISLKLRIVS